MKPIYRINATAFVKPKGKRNFKSITRNFELPDDSAKQLSKEALQVLAEALFKAKYGAEKVDQVRWVTIQTGVELNDVELWQD